MYHLHLNRAGREKRQPVATEDAALEAHAATADSRPADPTPAAFRPWTSNWSTPWTTCRPTDPGP